MSNLFFLPRGRLVPLILASAATAAPVYAQSVPADPVNPLSPVQRIDDYYERRAAIGPEGAAPDPVTESGVAANSPGTGTGAPVHFRLADVRFSPSVFLSVDTLEAIAARYRGREVGMDDLQHLLDEVNAAYATHGVTTAQAVLSAQAVQGGVIRVDLVEGRLGELRIVGLLDASEGFVRTRLRQVPGEPVDAQRLRDDLVHLNRTTDLRARALMQPGQAPGLTDIAIQVEAPSPRSFGVFVDNAGVESTGRERIGAQGQFWGLLGVNDLLAGSLAWASGGLEGRVGYSGIVNRRNGRLGASISRNQISIIDGAYTDLDITGESTSYGIDYRHPFVATQRWLLVGSTSLSKASSSTDISGERISETDSQIATVALSTGFRAPGVEINLTQAVSRVAIDEPLRATDNFIIAPGTLSWLQQLGKSRLLARTTLGWQYASSDFVPSGNLFQLGGVGTVRGYERGVLAGPRGYYANIELHRPYRERHDVYLFADYGRVEADFPARTDIRGVGVGLSGRWMQSLSYSLDLGHALDRVTGEQDSVRADFRIAMTWE